VSGPFATAGTVGQNAAGAGAGAVAGQGTAGATVTNPVQAGSGTGGSTNPAGTAGTDGNASAGSGAGAGGSSGESSMPAPTAGAGGSAPVTCPATGMQAGETTRTVQVGGTARTFILHVPQSYTGKTPVPFVIDWHGLGSTGAGQARVSGYKALSDQEGFIVAWPNGIDQAWNIGPCCTISRSVDDLAFAKAVVDDAKAHACIDDKRVYSTGYSMGGGMSHYLACNAADVFAAVAPSAFDLLLEDEEPCHPTRPITVIVFRGTADPIVPYAGGASRPPNGLDVTIHFLGAEATFKRWAELDGCTGMPMDTGGGCMTYSECKEGAAVTLCTTRNGSHDPGDAKIGWEMLRSHALP
jgi:polyhydroxybutyrate depolymerase